VFLKLKNKNIIFEKNAKTFLPTQKLQNFMTYNQMKNRFVERKKNIGNIDLYVLLNFRYI